MTTYQGKKILIVEDEIKIVEFIESYLLNSGYEVYKAYTAIEALSIFHTYGVDLILMDLMLPDLTGEEVCMEIRKTSTIPILILSAKSNEESIIEGLAIGADDYMTKPFSPRQMIARVNALLRRCNNQEGETITFNNKDLVINRMDYSVIKAGKPVSLTPSEYKILSTLIGRRNKVFTREELILLAFEGDYNGYDRTIDSHIKNLRSKIEDNTKDAVYIRTIRGVGYKFGGSKDEVFTKD